MDSWGPSIWSRLFGGVPAWRLTLHNGVVVAEGSAAWSSHVRELGRPATTKTGRWWLVSFAQAQFDGLSAAVAGSIQSEFERALAEEQRLDDVMRAVEADVERSEDWFRAFEAESCQPRWLPMSAVARLSGSRPELSALDGAIRELRLRDAVTQLSAQHEKAIDACQRLDLESWAKRRNEAFMQWERQQSAEFFRTVEKSPLTDEQIDATACFDDRVRVIASAGSGKTSTMVARAGYAMRRGIAQPHEILMLAFNKKAAEELKNRALERLGDDAAGITATTFHALGLRIIGESTDKKPALCPDLDGGKDTRLVGKIVDEIRDASEEFRRDWDLFRLVFGKPFSDLGEEPQPEAWDRNTKTSGFRTLNGEVVKSQEEVVIANWLFLNHVKYEYEREYEYNTADAAHRQYQPDFYYPDIDTYHEHWALGPDGQPPSRFEGYAESMAWRRQVHRDCGTKLIETTSASIRDGSGFEHLKKRLQTLGIQLTEDPYRDVPGEPPLSDRELISLLRDFMVHAKGNRLSAEELRSRAGTNIRARLFLRIYDEVATDWGDRLRAHRQVDFEDMLNLATDHLKAGHWASPFRVVMVDETQDTSLARAALVSALASAPGTFLYAVGDDWQSINRFAGSDLSVMTDFDRWFGTSQTVWLTQTFRSTQEICDAAGEFVQRNPAQISKQVRSNATPYEPAFQVISVPRNGYDRVVGDYLDELDRAQTEDATVLVLGRYNNMKETLSGPLRQRRQHLTVSFSTVHSAKGAEADFVLIPGMESRGGFPSTIVDDPLMELATSGADAYPFAEERRLFYVALTRAKKNVALFAQSGRESQFLFELLRIADLKIVNGAGDDVTPVICPKCRVNKMTLRSGKYGQFYGCSAYPACKGTRKVVE